ncbi:MAG: MFS transporter, partial [Deltaproteobacteria bacterium]
TGLGLLFLTLLGVGANVVLILSGVLSGCGHGFLFPCLNAFIIRDEPAQVRGKITGIFTGGIDAGSFLGSIVLGYIGQAGGYGALFLTAGIALFIGLFIYQGRVRHY